MLNCCPRFKIIGAPYSRTAQWTTLSMQALPKKLQAAKQLEATYSRILQGSKKLLLIFVALYLLGLFIRECSCLIFFMVSIRWVSLASADDQWW